jgi:hypothetical protein
MSVQKINLHINGVIVIQSLPDNERQTGRELYDDTIKRLCVRNTLHSGIIDVKSKDQFIQLPEILGEKNHEDQLCPFLHFEIHGDENGLMLANGELVSWAMVASVTRSINSFLKNELFISLATCKGAFILKGINDPTILAPFWGIVGPKDKIYLYEIIEDFTAFYQEFLTSFDLQKSIDELNRTNTRSPYVVMTAEVIFNQFIEEYFIDKPLDKDAKFKELSPKMKTLYPHLSQRERDVLLKKRIDKLDRHAFIEQCKNVFLSKPPAGSSLD